MWAVPLLEDLAKYEPDMLASINVSKPGEGSYSQSINELGRMFLEETDDDWFIPMNADVSCTGPFQHHLDEMDQSKIYGPTINTRGDLQWIDGWLYLIPREVWKEVGEFDEQFKIACFEDADYTWRCAQAGVGVAKVSGFPFKHHQASPRMRVPNFWKIRKQNQAYLREKWDLGDDWSYR
jgi:hypothetical protein